MSAVLLWRFIAELSQKQLLPCWDPGALYGLLDYFIMYPNRKPFFSQEGERRVVLLDKRSCKIPSNHHIDIVFIPLDLGYKGKVRRIK